MSENGHSGNGINYTVKEMLAQIDGKITMLGTKLDQKADRSTVHDLRSAVAALELTAIRRDGPMAAQIADQARQLESLQREQDRRGPIIERVAEKADVTYVNGVKEMVTELTERVESQTKAIYTASLSIMTGALILAFTLSRVFT